MIQLEQLSKAFGTTQVLNSFSYDFPLGITVILAPSGSGKTTLLRLIAGLDLPDSGQVVLPPGGISMVFQEDRLLPSLTLLDNVALPLESPQAAHYWLEQLGLGDHKDQYPASASGGMLRRTALARALAFPSATLLLDEPFKGLDPRLKTQVMALVKADAAKRHTLLITHDPLEAEQMTTCGILQGTGLPLTLHP